MEHVFAGIPVATIAAGAGWWERLLGREPDMRPNDSEVVWHLTESASLYVVEDAERVGNGLVTLFVDDMDGFLAGIVARGIDAGEVGEKPGVRVTTIVDPDGNRIQLGEVQQGRR